MDKLTREQKNKLYLVIADALVGDRCIYKDRLLDTCCASLPEITREAAWDNIWPLLDQNVLESVMAGYQINFGPRFHALREPELLEPSVPQLEVELRIKGVRFTKQQHVRLRDELRIVVAPLKDTMVGYMLIQQSFTINQLEFTFAELKDLMIMIDIEFPPEPAPTQVDGPNWPTPPRRW